MVKYIAIKDDLYYERILGRLQTSPSFRMVFKRDITIRLINDLKSIVQGKRGFRQNFALQVSGDPGSGKSIAVLSIGKILTKNFTWENMFFFDEEILEVANKIPPNTILVRDENPAKAVYGVGSHRVSSQVQLISETCRKYGLSIIFVEPIFNFTPIAKYHLETVDIGNRGKQRIVRLAVIDSKTQKYIGAVYIPIVPESDKDWIKYNEVKDAFIENIRSGDFRGARFDYMKAADEMLEQLDLELYKSKLERYIAVQERYPQLTTKEIELILAAIKLKLKSNQDVVKKDR